MVLVLGFRDEVEVLIEGPTLILAIDCGMPNVEQRRESIATSAAVRVL